MNSTATKLHRGRPRRAAVDAAIVRAALELMSERGVEGTTLAAVAKRAGVARATIYLRWPTRSALVGAAARAGVGGQPMPLTGDVDRDIRFTASFVRGVSALPAFRAVFPEIVRGVLANPPALSFDSVAPRRREFGRLYAQHAPEAGFRTDVDPYMAFDMILGTAIAHLLANGGPMSDEDARLLADVIIEGLAEG